MTNAPPTPSSLTSRVRRRIARETDRVGRGVRRLTASRRALPHFIIVGAQKGGTSSLHGYLSAHPQVLPPQKKEVHFFDVNFYRGERWYRSHFPFASALLRGGAITGEASPYYLAHPHAARRIASTVPDARLILLLRNPVQRAVSHYWHMHRRGREPLPMAEAFRREPERLDGAFARMLVDEHYVSYDHRIYSYLSRGLYVDQVARYVEHFDRSRLLILQSEAFFRDTPATYDAVLRFLGLEPCPLPPLPPRNVGRYRDEMPQGLREELDAFFRPHNQRLYDLLELDAPWW